MSHFFGQSGDGVFDLSPQEMMQVAAQAMVMDLADSVADAPKPHHPSYIENCRNKFLAFQADHEFVRLRYIRRGRRKQSGLVNDLFNIANALEAVAQDGSEWEAVKSASASLHEMAEERRDQEQAPYRRPIGLVMIAQIGDKKYASCAVQDRRDVWNKHVARYICLSRIKMLAEYDDNTDAFHECDLDGVAVCDDESRHLLGLGNQLQTVHTNSGEVLRNVVEIADYVDPSTYATSGSRVSWIQKLPQIAQQTARLLAYDCFGRAKSEETPALEQAVD